MIIIALIYLASLCFFIFALIREVRQIWRLARGRDKRGFPRLARAAVICTVLILFFRFAWQIPAFFSIETLHVPQGSQVYLKTKVEISDVNWWHIQGEKVIICPQPYEEVKEYVQSHNSALRRSNTGVLEYGNDMFSDLVYWPWGDKQYNALTQEEKRHYIKIRYYTDSSAGISVMDSTVMVLLGVLLLHKKSETNAPTRQSRQPEKEEMA